jgi:hypothetical protein
VNEAAGIGGVQDRWESEYQFIGAREAFQRVPDGMEPKCSARMIPPEGVPFVRPLIEDCYASLPPYYDEVPIDPRANRVSDEIWVMGRPRGGNRPPGFCTEEDNVTRPLRGEDIVMTYVLRCTPPSKQGSDRGSSERAD